MIKKIVVTALGVVLMAGTAFAAVTDEVKVKVDEVVRILADKDMKKKPKERREAVRRTVAAIFDYTEMTKRAVGPAWKDIPAADRKELTTAFSRLLENSYANKIESYNNEKITYTGEAVDGEYADVKSKIRSKGDDYAVDYRLMKQGNKWMVYDVVIEGTSLVSNYRTQFGRIIKTQGHPALLKKLQGKSND